MLALAMMLAQVAVSNGLTSPEFVAAVASHDPALGRSRASKPQASLVSLFSDDDYPMRALQRGQAGTVAVALSVSRTGRVTRCGITHSAGPLLDAATCRVIVTRALYEPARDRRGRAIAGRDTARIRWVIPSDDNESDVAPITPVALAASQSRISYVVRSGQPGQCVVEADAAQAVLMADGCGDYQWLARQAIGVRPSWIAEPYGLKLTTALTLDHPASASTGQNMLSQLAVALTIGADGGVVDCMADLQEAADPVNLASLCALARRFRFTASLSSTARHAWLRQSVDVVESHPTKANVEPLRKDSMGYGLETGALSGKHATGSRSEELARLFSSSDYPLSALLAHKQGRVAIRITIGPDGKATNCLVTGSSGTPELDQVTCSVIMARAMLEPLNPPRQMTLDQAINWAIPPGKLIPFATMIVRMSVRVSDGKIGSCVFDLESSVADPSWCAGFLEYVAELEKHPPSGLSRPYRVRFIGGNVIGALPPSTPGARTERRALTLTVDPAGIVIACHPVPGVKLLPQDTESFCKESVVDRFEAVPMTSHDRPNREIVKIAFFELVSGQ